MVKRIIALIKSEPAVFLGALATVVVGAYQLVTRHITWEAFEPLLAGFVTRFFVSPATS